MSDLQPSKQTVERGARALSDARCVYATGDDEQARQAERDRVWDRAKNTNFAQRYDALRREAEAVLTAALRLDDPETVERVARAINVALRASLPTRCLGTPERTAAKAALSALLGTESEPRVRRDPIPDDDTAVEAVKAHKRAAESEEAGGGD